MKTSIQTVTSNLYLLEMDEREIQAAIADPYSLQPALRALYTLDAEPATALPRARKKPTKRRGRKPGRKSAAVVNCRFCERGISSRQITNHERKCTLRPADYVPHDD